LIKSNHQVAREFIAALCKGSLPDDLLTADLTVWTTSSGRAGGKEHYRRGVKLLASVTVGGLAYTIDSLTAEDDRVAAEVQSRGTLVNGEAFHMHYLFLLRVRDGRIASIAEHINPLITNAKLAPLLQAALRS
jgi:ketosteroid isomerase-like protein